MKHALITGGAGFIGSHLADRLLSEGWRVTTVDNFDPFYDPEIKRANVESHFEYDGYKLIEADIRNQDTLRSRLGGDYDVIVHLAAKVAARPSIKDPVEYQEVNVRGAQNLLELARTWGVKQFVFASSSSVYGVNPNVPWREKDHILLPISPYAGTKVSGELMGHVYSRLFGIRFIALRFFTVYGPRQRPDMAIHKFARLMLQNETIPIFGDGSTRRDCTYVTDIVNGIRAAMDYRGSSYEVVNLGNNRTVKLTELVAAMEQALGLKAQLRLMPEQPGDVPQTWADIRKAKRLLDYQPAARLPEGLTNFAHWLFSEGLISKPALAA
ncbi:MAG: GDP-mannose 4,6-dehydratase [Armatimonadota bacterium]|nr:GDP-mannose 4,6-dehydratase [Armatimonadota bacterium]